MNRREAHNASKATVDFLFAECAKRHISLNKMSVDTGLSLSSLSDIRNGKQMPGYYTLCIIADYLGLEFNLVSKKH